MFASLFLAIGSTTTTFLRRLVDPVVQVLPSKIPGDMLKTVDVLDKTSREIFNDSVTKLNKESEAEEGRNLIDDSDSKNLLNLLRESCFYS